MTYSLEIFLCSAYAWKSGKDSTLHTYRCNQLVKADQSQTEKVPQEPMSQVRKIGSRFNLVKEISTATHVATVRTPHIQPLLSNTSLIFCFHLFLFMWTFLVLATFYSNKQRNTKRGVDIIWLTKVHESLTDTPICATAFIFGLIHKRYKPLYPRQLCIK